MNPGAVTQPPVIDSRTFVVRALVARERTEAKRQRLEAQTHTTTPARQAALEALLIEFGGNDTTAQTDRLFAALRSGPLTTFEARKFLDISAPASRVLTLRAAGHNIVTLRVHEESRPGCPHCIAMYTLVQEVDE